MPNPTTTIDVEATSAPAANQPQTQAVTLRQTQAVGAAMSVADIVAQVQLVQQVMAKVMTEGEHYGKIPGCGEKKCLLQPGAQKLTLTFRLAPEYTIQDIDLPGGHKEYRVTCRLTNIPTGQFWGAGVGCCSSMESKYRYRGGSRKCPDCGAEAIIKGKNFKNPNGPGEWVCWKKKGGCGNTWPLGTAAIENQSEEKVENENPADCWNTVLKMAKKRAYVDATITATAASDIFTQDIDDTDERPEASEPPRAPQTSRGTGPSQTQAHRQNAPQTSQSAQKPPQSAPAPEKPAAKAKIATEATRVWMLNELQANPGQPGCQVVTEYFQKVGQILPTESLDALPLHFIPVSRAELGLLRGKLALFEQGAAAEKAFEPHFPPSPGQSIRDTREQTASAPPTPAPTPAPAANQQQLTPAEARAAELRKADRDWFMKVIVPIPNRGQKRDDYMKDPDTIGRLHTSLKEGHEDAGRRLWGFVNHYEPKPWIKRDGSSVPPSETDLLFRLALDEYAGVHGDNQDPDPEPELLPSQRASVVEPELPEHPGEEDDIPF